MIYCPNCGTSNRKGSRFCNECGEPLPSTGTRCPMCDTINPVGNVYCQRCNARLVPVSPDAEEEAAEEKARPIKGFSLPTIPLDETEGEEERDTPAQAEEEESTSEDWLDELRGSSDRQPEGTEEEEPTQEDQELEPADIPDWLSELGPVSEEVPLSTGVEAHPAEETPVREDTTSEEPGAGEAETTEEQPSPSAPAETDEPETKPAPPSEAEAAPEPAEIPDWLRELGPVSEETPPVGEEPLTTREPVGEESDAGPPRVEEPVLKETPEWLRDVLPSEAGAAAPTEAEAADTEPAAIEIPDWLREAEAGVPPSPPEEAEETEAEQAGSPGIPPESVKTPSWLREAESGLEKAATEGSVSPFTEAPPEGLETPDWLAELMTPTGEEVTEGSPFPEELDVTEEEWNADLERADIPDWLRELRPTQDEGEEAVRGPLETEGLLKGLRGLIPAAHAIGAPTTFESPAGPQTSEASLARAELLQSLLGQPAIEPTVKPRREARERRPDVRDLAERWLVAGVLILAVLGVLLAPLVTGQGVYLTQPVTGSGATDLHRVVGELDAGDHVLVAFDYGPPEADELSAVARPVLTHVLERGAQISTVSTRPEGPLIARAMMSRIADSEEQYTSIGYRPGTVTAISQLLNATEGTPTLLLVLTSRPMPFRLWIEQAYARYGDQLPVVAASSAALEPIASPYRDASAGQLRGAIHGLKGAAGYEALRGTIGSATQRLDALTAGHIAIVMLMLVGALVHAVGGAKEERI